MRSTPAHDSNPRLRARNERVSGRSEPLRSQQPTADLPRRGGRRHLSSARHRAASDRSRLAGSYPHPSVCDRALRVSPLSAILTTTASSPSPNGCITPPWGRRMPLIVKSPRSLRNDHDDLSESLWTGHGLMQLTGQGTENWRGERRFDFLPSTVVLVVNEIWLLSKIDVARFLLLLVFG